MTEQPFTPRRGDLVSFLNDVLYFQPNGSSCYLYKRRQDIGKTSLAKYSPARECIRKPTAYDLATKVVTAKSYESP